jgi:hypothetical protein
MRATNAHRAETAIGYAAATSFAAAVGFAAFHAVGRFMALPGMLAGSCVAALLAWPVAGSLLRLLEGQPKPFPAPHFDSVEFVPVGSLGTEELELTDLDRLKPETEDEALVLEDVLAETSPESRVVQLFDPAAMPAPEQHQTLMDRHPVGGRSTSSPDASEALFAALAELRRSLR